jgi:hypothetical protein
MYLAMWISAPVRSTVRAACTCCAVPVACPCHNAQSRSNTGGSRTTGGLHAGHRHSDIMLWYVPVELHSSQNPQPGGNCSSRIRVLHPLLQLFHQAGSCLQNILLQLLRGPHRFLVARTRAGGGVSSQLHGVIVALGCRAALLLPCYFYAAVMLLLCSCHAAAVLLLRCCTAAASGMQLHSHAGPSPPEMPACEVSL